MENIRSIYTLLLLTICTTAMQADVTHYLHIGKKQSSPTPQVTNTIYALFTGETEVKVQSPSSVSVVCIDDAGTVAPTINGVPATNPVGNYLNWGDSLVIVHSGGDASQDGDALSAPGFDLAIYENGPPDSTGPTAAAIIADANYTGTIVGTDINGSGFVQNAGGYQNFFNGGDPVQLWFAPVTLDDHANQDLTENAGGANECVNVNVSEEFNVVWLNQIDTFNFTNPALPNGDACVARIRLQGGLPQWDPTTQYTISITKTTAPFSVATLNTTNHIHNSLLEFTVPEAGDYDIVVSDNNGASRTFTVPMNACVNCSDTAGTASVALGTTASSGNTSFLCFGDSLIVTHDGNADLAGDPNTATPSGLGYVMYTAQPALVSGNTLADFNSDPNIVNQTGSATGFDLVNGTDINGNVSIVNDGLTYQNILGGVGSTGELWFAPITIDDHANGGFEAVNTPNECTDISTGSPFSVVFLNEIQVANVSTTLCDGSFDVTGGLPQHDASNYVVSIVLTTNSLITGTVTQNATHGGTVNFTVPQPGTYLITVTDAIGCSGPSFTRLMNTCPFPCTGVVNATMNITSDFNGANISCNAANDGQITVSVNGGTPPLVYDWSHDAGLNANVASSLTAGSYTVTVTDANGCADTQTVALVEPAAFVVELDSTPVLCNGDMTSMVYVSAISGGTMPYNYSWSGGTPVTTGDTTTMVGAGTYTVTITDANNCQTTQTLILPEPPALTTTTTDVVDTDCDASANGTGTVVPAGGAVTNNDYNYTWSHDAALNDSVAMNLVSGTYYVTVSDDNGCTATDSIVINAAKTIVLDLDSTDVDCGGASTGAVTVNVTTTGGTANTPYTFTWSHDPLLNANMASNLTAGTYTVTVTDALGCFSIDSIVVNEPTPIVITAQSVTDVNCVGDMTGAATVSVTGGTMPYTYAWSTSTSTGPSISSMGAGTHTVTVTDANNCSQTFDVVINTISTLGITQIDTTALVCAGDMNGGFVVTYSGGVNPVTYSWSTNPLTDTTNAISGIGAGIYYVTVSDGLGCSRVDTFNLSSPTPMSGTISGTNLVCATDQNGTAVVQVSGGTMPYTYTWSANSVNNDTLSGLSAGQYFVTVTDVNGCNYIDSITLTSPDIIDITVNTTDVSCLGGSNGTATATVTGGTGAYTYLWDSTQTGQTATQLGAGTHVLIVTDQSGCQMTDTFVIVQVPAMLPNALESQPVSCFGGSDGTATIGVTGGTEPYTYIWNTNPAQDSSTAVGLSAGTYEVIVIDANGCALQPISITVNEPQPLIIDTVITSDPLCNNSDDGSIIVIPSGGTPSYSYEWSGSNELTNTNNNLFAGSYTVTVTDANGCTTTASAVLDDPLILVAQISTTPTTCNGGKDGRIQIDTVLGGQAPYSYSIDGVNFLPSDVVYFGLFGGNYEITVRDANGCTYVETVQIEEPPLITVDLGPDFELDLGDSAQLEAFVNTSDQLTYSWEASDSGSISCFDCFDPWVNPIASANYIVTVVDSNGCEASDDIFVKIDKNRRIFIPTAFSPNNDGINDRFIIYGGTGVVEILTFRVFNRWGELVYQANNFEPSSYAHGWDGTFRGKTLNPGVFVYTVEARFSDGVIFPYKGDVTLLK